MSSIVIACLLIFIAKGQWDEEKRNIDWNANRTCCPVIIGLTHFPVEYTTENTLVDGKMVKTCYLSRKEKLTPEFPSARKLESWLVDHPSEIERISLTGKLPM